MAKAVEEAEAAKKLVEDLYDPKTAFGNPKLLAAIDRADAAMQKVPVKQREKLWPDM